jgi:predicted transposase/invertase (TIGR01784 family)
MDDEFMSVVFDGDNELTALVLRIILNRGDLTVKKTMTQSEKRNLYGRSVKLDILAEDTTGKLYDIEIQRADKGASPKRARANLSALDSKSLKKGDDFASLPETYIIFITENDIYHLNKPFYEVEKSIKGVKEPFDDGSHTIFVNGAYRKNDAIGMLMHDFCEANADEMYYSEIAEKVRFHKNQTDGGNKTMSRIFEEYGREVAAEARMTALAERNDYFVRKLIARGDMSLEEIADITEVPLEKVQEIAGELS